MTVELLRELHGFGCLNRFPSAPLHWWLMAIRTSDGLQVKLMK